MPNDLIDRVQSFSSLANYPFVSWSEFAQHPTETDVIVPTPCVYCKRKVMIPVGAPLLQGGNKCGADVSQWKQKALRGGSHRLDMKWIIHLCHGRRVLSRRFNFWKIDLPPLRRRWLRRCWAIAQRQFCNIAHRLFVGGRGRAMRSIL